MKKGTFLQYIVLSFLVLFAKNVQAQSVTASNNTILTPNTTRTVTLTRSDGDFTGSGQNYTWSVLPLTGVSIANTVLGPGNVNSTNTLTFNSGATGQYTVTVSRGTTSVSTIITIINGITNFWAAYNGSTGSNSVHAFNILSGVRSNGPALLFEVNNGAFAALGRGPFPTVPTGYFYWLPNTTGNNGVFTMYGQAGDGSGAPATIISSFDVNGGSVNSLGYVRLGLDKFGVAWVVTASNSQVYLVKVTPNALNPIASSAIEVVDDNITLVGGSITTFQNGDLCFDGSNNMYVLVNNGGTTQVFIGQPNGINTMLTKKWDILDGNGNNFSGSVNGCCFDEFGGMYLSTTNNTPGGGVQDGICYLDPLTISLSNTSPTIQATLVYAATGYTDLGTNVWPLATPLPLVFGEVTAILNDNGVTVDWETYSEKDVNIYEVEMSLEGKDFISRDAQKAHGVNSLAINKYTAQIEAPEHASQLFFRIKSIDYSGMLAYSKVVKVTLPAYADSRNTFDIFPNPVSQSMNINIQTPENRSAVFSIRDYHGKLMLEKSFEINKGANILELNNIAGLSSGIYIMSTIINGETVSRQFVK